MQKFSNITCPECGDIVKEEMPNEVCVISYECRNCEKLIFAQTNKCCVFCSYGDTQCPPAQRGEDCC